eukprot:scaffold349922_cov119-Cyclotella_meneghiniana.AAC.1
MAGEDHWSSARINQLLAVFLIFPHFDNRAGHTLTIGQSRRDDFIVCTYSQTARHERHMTGTS